MGRDGHADMGRPDGGRGDVNRISIPRDGMSRDGRADYGADRIRGREPQAIEEAGRRGRDDDASGWHDRSDRDRPDRDRPDRDRSDRADADRGSHDRSDSPSSGRRPIRDPREDSWAEQRMRDLVAPRVPDPIEDSVDRGWHGGRDDDPSDDDRWAAMRSGDRWAEVRTDERGRELRMGERRTAVRADETGTQMRIVDRWSSVRQENVPYADSYESPAQHGSTGGHGSGSDASDGWRDASFRGGVDNTGETRSERRRREEAERGRPALPSSGPESAAGWVRGHGDDSRADRRDDRSDDPRAGTRASLSRADRSPRDISGEVVRRAGATDQPAPRRADHGWSEPQRAAAEPRSAHRSSDTGGRAAERTPEARSDRRPTGSRPAEGRRADGGGDDRWGGRSEAPESGRARDHGDDRYGARPSHGGREARDDNRWEREPSGGRSAVRPRLEFDDTDDRWR